MLVTPNFRLSNLPHMHVFILRKEGRELTENPCEGRTCKVQTEKSEAWNPNAEPSLERDSSLFKRCAFFFFLIYPPSPAESLRSVLRVPSSRLPVAAVLLVVASERARHTQDFGGFELASIITVGSHRRGPLFIYWLQPTGSLDCGNHTERRGEQRRSVCGDAERCSEQAAARGWEDIYGIFRNVSRHRA